MRHPELQRLSVVELGTKVVSIKLIKQFKKAVVAKLKSGREIPFLKLISTQTEQLLHNPSFSVMGKIGMVSQFVPWFFRLIGLKDERMAESMQYFRSVRMSDGGLRIPLTKILSRFVS